jgi:hypothetical protein
MVFREFLNNRYVGAIILIIVVALLIIGFPRDKNVIDKNQKDTSLSNGISGVSDLSRLDRKLIKTFATLQEEFDNRFPYEVFLNCSMANIF